MEREFAGEASNATWYDRSYRIRFDPTERLARSRRFHQAAERLRAGLTPEILGLGGIGPSRPTMISKNTEAR